MQQSAIRDNHRIFFVQVSDVIWIEAAGNYACIHTAKASHLLRETMATLEARLASQRFIRIRKSSILNSALIREARPMFNGEYDLVLHDGKVFTSSRRYRQNIQRFLAQ